MKIAALPKKHPPQVNWCGVANRSAPPDGGTDLAAKTTEPVLLVDDDPVQLRVREAVLRRGGFEVAVATSADSALALLRGSAKGFSVVVTDHIMPGASGSDFVRMLRAVDADVPVVVVTGLPDAEPEYAGLNISFQQKPVQPEELIRLIQSLT